MPKLLRFFILELTLFFLWNNGPYNSFIPWVSSSYTVIPIGKPEQCAALLQFRSSGSFSLDLSNILNLNLFSIVGAVISWPLSLTDTSTSNCCIWYGVTCDDSGNVISL